MTDLPPEVATARIAVMDAARAVWALATQPVEADAPARFEAAVDALIVAARNSVGSHTP